MFYTIYHRYLELLTPDAWLESEYQDQKKYADGKATVTYDA